MQAIGDFFGTIFGPIGQIFHYLFYLPVYNILMITYEGLNKIFPGGAFAIAIIILTLLIRSALIPLTRKQLQSTRKMQMVQPHLKELQQRHRGDPQTLMAEQRRLYKEHGVSMYGGCLPLLIQMPFIYALYGAFLTVIHNTGKLTEINKDLYPFVPHLSAFPQTHFLWTSLITPDPWHILPVLAALLTFVQLRMAMPVRKPRQPGENPDPTMQATATTQYIMPLVTLFIGWTFPSGLALYWCISTGFSAVQQYFINGNWGSLFVGVPGMEHLVPPPKDLTPTVTRTPAVAGSASARALTPPASAASTAPEEGGLRGWWQRMKESAAAAQSQATERAEQARQEYEQSKAQSRQQAAERDESGAQGAATSTRRQRPSKQAPILVKPPQPASGDETGSDEVDQVIKQATNQSVLPEQKIANGTNGKLSASVTNGASAPKGSGGTGVPKGTPAARSGASGTRPTTGGSNAARKKSAKGGSGSRSSSGRPKGGK